MDSNFSNNRAPDEAPAPAESSAATPSAPAAATPAVSAATARFHSCRWRKAPSEENTLPDHCTHRDVLPMAGTAGFSPDSWCTDCGFYKAKRTPRKRQEEPPTQDSWRRW
ncbi:MAG: hypothetical protein H0T71_07705 [Acidobacteria bacterium]|nr:hypothetical protein [Acidobacteriota bacterium]